MTTSAGAATTSAGAATTPPGDPLREFETDPVLEPFLADDFDAVTYASESLTARTSKTVLPALDAGIKSLNAALRGTVTSHYDELLQQLGGIDESERVLEIVRDGVHNLQRSMGKVRVEIVEPHEVVAAKTKQLENLTRTVETLHRVIRTLKLTGRLKDSLGASGGDDAEGGAAVPHSATSGDLAKAAKMLADASELEREGVVEDQEASALAGIEVIDRDARWLERAGKDVRSRATQALNAGMDATSQAEVGAALQVFHNLGELDRATDAVIARLANDAVDVFREALDPRELARAMGGGVSASERAGGVGVGGGRGIWPPAGQEHRWAEALWQRLGAACERAKAAGMGAWHLQRVLAKKRDPISHALFLDEVIAARKNLWREKVAQSTEAEAAASNPEDAISRPCERFVWQLSKGAGEAFGRAHAAAGFARDTLLKGFPRLVTLIEGLHEGLAKESGAAATAAKGGVPPAVRKDGSDLTVLLHACDAVSNAYLARSFQRLSEPVNALLSPSALQSLQGIASGQISASGTVGTRAAAEDVRRFLLRVREELDAVARHPTLVTQVTAGAVAKALRLMAQKAEIGVVDGAEARVFVVGTAQTPAQAKNAALAGVLEEICAALGNVVPLLPDEPAKALENALAQVAETATEALEPVMSAAHAEVHKRLASMHKEDWAGGDPPMGEGCSTYMTQVIDVVAHVSEEHLSGVRQGSLLGHASSSSKGASGFVPSTIAAEALARRCLELFVRHVSLLRNLGENGKLRLTKDMGELEQAVSAYLVPATSSLGDAYKALRALRPFLFLSLDEVASSALVEDIPAANVLLHLYSHAPKEMATPYERAGLAPPQYSAWLDKNSDAEVWAGVKGTLEAYESQCKTRGVTPHAAVDVMRLVGSRAFEKRRS